MCALFLTGLHLRPFILFPNRKDIRLMEISDQKRKTNTNIIVKNLEDAAALDYFLELNQVCWSEINREVIRCANIDPHSRGKVVKKDIVSSGLIKPEGLACDWVNNMIYWTDSDTKRIEVAGLTGLDRDRTVLVWQDLDMPRALSVDPLSGYMFWTDWGEYPKIERCGMNGDPGTRKILVDNDLVWPNGLSLDNEKKRVYWIEAQLSYIASVDWEGHNRKTLLVGDRLNLPQPFAISFFSGVLFWTDWDTNSLYQYNQSDDRLNKLKIKGKLTPMDLRVFEPDRQPAGVSPCRNGNGGCSHICLAAPQPPYYSCKCPTGRKMLNSSACADSNNEMLLLAAREYIVKVSLDTSDYTDIVIPLSSVVNSIAIDYDPVSNRVFWTDLADQNQAIRSAKLDGSNETDVVTTDIDHPDGLAVDWVGRNIFWTDSGTDRIEISRLDGSSRRVLISEDLDEPRSIALDSINGWIYWSDWGKNPRIERCWMDGRKREIVIDTELIWPNEIALDIPRQKVYWCDAKMDRIEMSNMDGSERSILLDQNLPHPFGFTLLGSRIYWTDWQDRNIQSANKYNGRDRQIIVSHLNNLMGIMAVKANPTEMPNPCQAKSCSHLCLITPEGALCSCPNGYELTSDNKTCVVPDAFLLYSSKDDIRRISIETPNTNVLLPLKGVEEASSLDFDRKNGMIYWTDTKSNAISRAFLNGSNQELVIEYGLMFPEGLAVDWMSRNLYWTDAGAGRIEMARLDGSNRRVLHWQNVNSPRSLAVDPILGKIYWASWGEVPVIEKSMLDGSGRELFVQGEGRANALTVHMESHRLYWADQDSQNIKYIDTVPQSGEVKVLVSGSRPFALTQFKSNLYWTDWTLHTVSRISLDKPTAAKQVHVEVDNVKDILAYHLDHAIESSPCDISDCSGLCTIQITDSSMGMVCTCPSHYVLAPDNKTCTAPHAFLLFGQRNKISRLLLEENQVPDIILPIRRARSIQSLEYNPVDKYIYWVDQGKREQHSRRIIRRARDNGMSDSLNIFDKGDQVVPYDMAIDPYTQNLYWTCELTNSINVTRLANGGSTPLGPLYIGGASSFPRLLALYPRKQLLFVTMSGGLTGTGRIDAIQLGTDYQEQLVNTSVTEITAICVDTSTDTVFWADRGLKKLEVIHIKTKKRQDIITEGILEPVGMAVQNNWLYWADRDHATIVRADKFTGAARQTILSRVSRLSSLVSAENIPLHELQAHPCHYAETHGCSHFCYIGTDNLVECSCPVGKVLLEDKKECGSPSCQPNEFACHNKGRNGDGPMCIPATWRCDGQPECGDRSDELNCYDCGPTQFRCDRGQCVPSVNVCDGVSDCEDGKDEESCCAESQFQCTATRKCIDRDKLCDGEPDCGDSSDERPPQCKPNGLPFISGGSEAATATTSTYLISIFAGLISLFLLTLLVYYCKRRKRKNTLTGDQDATRPLASIPNAEIPDLAGTLNRDSDRVARSDPMVNSAAGGMSPAAGSSNGLLYDRSHVTGASSTADTSSSGNYQGHGPPPSPATSVGTRLTKVDQLRGLGKRGSGSAFNAGIPTGYRFYNYREAPPCTPCSTDVNDESDSLAYSALPSRQHFTSRAGSVAQSRTGGYESETYCIEEVSASYVGELPSLQERGQYAPPPSTPLYLSDCGEQETSFAPSPNTERSFFLNPCLAGPPPSPVPSPTRNKPLDEYS